MRWRPQRGAQAGRSSSSSFIPLLFVSDSLSHFEKVHRLSTRHHALRRVHRDARLGLIPRSWQAGWRVFSLAAVQAAVHVRGIRSSLRETARRRSWTGRARRGNHRGNPFFLPPDIFAFQGRPLARVVRVLPCFAVSRLFRYSRYQNDGGLRSRGYMFLIELSMAISFSQGLDLDAPFQPRIVSNKNHGRYQRVCQLRRMDRCSVMNGVAHWSFTSARAYELTYAIVSVELRGSAMACNCRVAVTAWRPECECISRYKRTHQRPGSRCPYYRNQKIRNAQASSDKLAHRSTTHSCRPERHWQPSFTGLGRASGKIAIPALPD